MTARSFGEIAFGLLPTKSVRSWQPVRRDSATIGEREQQVWKPLADNNRDARRLIAARLTAAERYDRERKVAGSRNGALGHVALEVLRELYRMVDFRTGRLDPAISTLCERIRRSRAAVVAAMARLREHGFLTWIRRCEPTGTMGAGPQIRQATNAYGLSIPEAVVAWVKRIVGPPPVPACELARREADRAATEAMLASATTQEIVGYYVGHEGGLSEIMQRLGAALEQKSASSPGGQKPCSSLL